MARPKKEKLKKRSDNRFRCKWHGKQFYSSISYEDALAKRDAYKAQIDSGCFIDQTVSEYALPWLERTFPDVAMSTYNGSAIHVQHLVDSIGDKLLSKVLPSDIKSIYSQYYKGLSHGYIMRAKYIFSSMFDSAVADGIIRSNPAREKTAKPHKGAQPTTRPLTAQERHWVETLCTNHRAYPAVMTMLYAGLRPQEVKAIKIERDIDFEKRTITVHETVHQHGYNKYDYTDVGKTENANRTIPLLPPLYNVLKGRTGYLITTAHGEKITASTWKVVWHSYINSLETAINGCKKQWYGKKLEHKKILDAGGQLPEWISLDFVPYCFRKTYCVFLRDNEVELNCARKWMGHADLNMILKIYDSVSEDRIKQQREKLETRLYGVQNGVQTKKENPQPVETQAVEGLQ